MFSGGPSREGGGGDGEDKMETEEEVKTPFNLSNLSPTFKETSLKYLSPSPKFHLLIKKHHLVCKIYVNTIFQLFIARSVTLKKRFLI